MPDSTSVVSLVRRPVVNIVLALVSLTACRDVNLSEPLRTPGGALAAKSGNPASLPFHINESFRGAPGATRIDCGPDVSVPSRLIAEGVVAPHMGRTRSSLAVTSCEVADGIPRLGAQATVVGATGDSLFGDWIITVGEIRDGKAELTLEIVFLNGSDWFEDWIGVETGTGSLDLASGSGSYSAAGTIGPRAAGPPPAEGLVTETISAGMDNFVCGLAASGAAYCWGSNGYGQLGDGTMTGRLVPTPVTGGHTFTQISAGAGHVCGLTSSGNAYCWGRNTHGELGTGDTINRTAPTRVASRQAFTQISAVYHTCAVTASGAAYCWGFNYWGGIGDGTTTERHKPTAVHGGILFESIGAGAGHTCGLTSTGAAYCWGLNFYGQLGDGTTADRYAPTAVVGGHTFAQVSVGGYHTCALLANSMEPYCWGWNQRAQLGDGTWSNRYAPTLVLGGFQFAQISPGDYHTCAVSTLGEGYCWGENTEGMLGDGIGNSHSSPYPVAGGISFKQISAAEYYTCAVSTSGVGYCWGENFYGQLGDGTTTSRYAPTAIPGLVFKY